VSVLGLYGIFVFVVLAVFIARADGRPDTRISGKKKEHRGYDVKRPCSPSSS